MCCMGVCVRACSAYAVCGSARPCLCRACARGGGSNAGWVKPDPARSPSEARGVRCCGCVSFWDGRGGQRPDSHPTLMQRLPSFPGKVLEYVPNGTNTETWLTAEEQVLAVPGELHFCGGHMV